MAMKHLNIQYSKCYNYGCANQLISPVHVSYVLYSFAEMCSSSTTRLWWPLETNYCKQPFKVIWVSPPQYISCPFILMSQRHC